MTMSKIRLFVIGSITVVCRLAKVIAAAVKIQCLARRYIAWNKVEAKRFERRKCALIILAREVFVNREREREREYVLNPKAC